MAAALGLSNLSAVEVLATLTRHPDFAINASSELLSRMQSRDKPHVTVLLGERPNPAVDSALYF